MKILKLAGVLGILAAGPALAAADVSVIQKDQSFSRDSIEVAAGDTVLWGNADDFNHNISVRSPDGAQDDLGIQAHGQVLKHTFGLPGSYRIICHIHPKMKMTVVVK